MKTFILILLLTIVVFIGIDISNFGPDELTQKINTFNDLIGKILWVVEGPPDTAEYIIEEGGEILQEKEDGRVKTWLNRNPYNKVILIVALLLFLFLLLLPFKPQKKDVVFIFMFPVATALAFGGYNIVDPSSIFDDYASLFSLDVMLIVLSTTMLGIMLTMLKKENDE